MKMFLLTYRGKPNANSKDAKEVGGAYINCWIKERKFEKADMIARKEIESANWRIETLEEVIQVNKKYYSYDDPKLEYYKQALIDDAVFVFHTYPKRKKRTKTKH